VNCVLVNSLIIARGKVTCNDAADGSRIISGKSVIAKREPMNCIIAEKEMNPLGFIRWTEAKKTDVSAKRFEQK
jgi:hypothetical protein